MTLAPTWYLENITQSTHMFFSLILSDLISCLYIISDYYKRPDQINTERRKPNPLSVLNCIPFFLAGRDFTSGLKAWPLIYLTTK